MSFIQPFKCWIISIYLQIMKLVYTTFRRSDSMPLAIIVFLKKLSFSTQKYIGFLLLNANFGSWATTLAFFFSFHSNIVTEMAKNL